jgi:hypothetical protein
VILGRVVEDTCIFSLLMKVLSVFFILSFSSQAQMILNDTEYINEDILVFNPAFIKSQGIQSIKGRISVKRPNSTIRTTNDYREYFFDTLGRIVSSYESNSYRDTLWREYFYNGKGYLIYQSSGTKSKYNYSSYQYDDEGRIVGIEDYERENDYLGIPKTKLLKKRTFDYKPCDTTCVKIILSDKGTPFMKEEMFTLLNGKPKRIETRYLATQEGIMESFEYDAYGRIRDRITRTTKQELEKEHFTFKYDALGNVMERKFFDQGSLLSETQYIVNEKTGMLSAIIEEKEVKGYLFIIRFGTFEYFD